MVTPLATGLIMAVVSKVVAALVIIGWHAVAMIIEICLLTTIYGDVPDLQKKVDLGQGKRDLC